MYSLQSRLKEVNAILDNLKVGRYDEMINQEQKHLCFRTSLAAVLIFMVRLNFCCNILKMSTVTTITRSTIQVSNTVFLIPFIVS